MLGSIWRFFQYFRERNVELDDHELGKSEFFREDVGAARNEEILGYAALSSL